MPHPAHTTDNTSDTEKKPASDLVPNVTEKSNQSGSNASSAAPRNKSEVEKEAEKLYEERIEEEYAKREGGA